MQSGKTAEWLRFGHTGKFVISLNSARFVTQSVWILITIFLLTIKCPCPQ